MLRAGQLGQPGEDRDLEFKLVGRGQSPAQFARCIFGRRPGGSRSARRLFSRHVSKWRNGLCRRYRRRQWSLGYRPLEFNTKQPLARRHHRVIAFEFRKQFRQALEAVSTGISIVQSMEARQFFDGQNFHPSQTGRKRYLPRLEDGMAPEADGLPFLARPHQINKMFL